MDNFQIPSVNLGPHDVLVAHVGVNALPRIAAERYLVSVQTKLKEVFGDDQPMMCIAVVGIGHMTFSVIHRETRPERKVFKVEIGEGMSPEQVRRQMDNVRAAMHSTDK